MTRMALLLLLATAAPSGEEVTRDDEVVPFPAPEFLVAPDQDSLPSRITLRTALSAVGVAAPESNEGSTLHIRRPRQAASSYG